MKRPMTAAQSTRYRARFDAIRAAILLAHGRYLQVCAKLVRKYGQPLHMAVMRSNKTNECAWERARVGVDRHRDRLFALLEQISPRDWRSGVPCDWVARDLTYDDAIRPLSEPLSITPPCSYGCTNPIK